MLKNLVFEEENFLTQVDNDASEDVVVELQIFTLLLQNLPL